MEDLTGWSLWLSLHKDNRSCLQIYRLHSRSMETFPTNVSGLSRDAHLHCKSVFLTSIRPDCLIPKKYEIPECQLCGTTKQASGNGMKGTYLPLLSCILGLAPAWSRASAICAISDITSVECFFELYNATRCNGVSWAPNVAALTRAPFLIRKVAAKRSP